MAGPDEVQDQLHGLAERVLSVEDSLRRHVKAASGDISLQLRRYFGAAGAEVSLQHCADRCGMAAARLEQLGQCLAAPAGTTPTDLLKRSIANAAVQRFEMAVAEQVEALEDLSVSGTQLGRLQQAADRVLQECARLADILTTHAPIYADELPGMAATALGLLGKVRRAVAFMPAELASMIRFCNASFDKAEAAERIIGATGVGGYVLKRVCFPKLQALVLEYKEAAPAEQGAVFDGITDASPGSEVFGCIMAVPAEALASLRSSGYGFSPDFPEAAAAMQPLGMTLDSQTSEQTLLKPLQAELGRLLGLQQVHGLRYALVSLDTACSALEATPHDLSLLDYVQGSVLAPLAELQQVVAAERLLPSEVQAELQDLSRGAASIHATYAKLKRKLQAGQRAVQGPQNDDVADQMPSASEEEAGRAPHQPPRRALRQRNAVAQGLLGVLPPRVLCKKDDMQSVHIDVEENDVALEEGKEMWVSAHSSNLTTLAKLLGVGLAGPHLQPTKDTLKFKLYDSVLPNAPGHGTGIWEVRVAALASARARASLLSGVALLELTDPLPAAALHLFLECYVTACLGEEDGGVAGGAPAGG
ncbi:hypothetical protein ABPG75_004381 [Micractinium tetrahymenae]